MMDMGFWPDVRRIISELPSTRQTLLFSATMPDDVVRFALEIVRDAKYVQVGQRSAPPKSIAHRVESVSAHDKITWLIDHLKRPEGPVLIFSRTKIGADRLARRLAAAGVKCTALHADRSQDQRRIAVEGFKGGKYKVLVATDIAARGLDIAGLTHVFNYDLPDTPETYVHRIGRTGRAGESGVAITLVAREDEDGVRSIERYLARRRGGPASASGEGRRTAHTSTRRDATRTAAPSPRDTGGQRTRSTQDEPAQHAAAPAAQETTDAAPRSQRRRRRHWSSGPRPAANPS